jgi:predicted permease
MLKSTALTPLAGVAGSARLAVVFGETSSGRNLRVSYPDYVDLRDRSASFAGLFGSTLATVNLGRGRDARQVWSEVVTGNYFQVLGVRAALGRTLLPADEVAPGRHPVVVISHGLWQRQFAGDPNVIGSSVDINNYPMTVVGVADPSFHGTIVSNDVEVFVPVMMWSAIGLSGGLPQDAVANALGDRRAQILFPQGFLKPSASMASTRDEIDALWSSTGGDRRSADGLVRLRLVPFWRSPTGGQTYVLPTLGVLVAMGLLVLLIACANIAGLVLVRGVSRRGEVALRLALGASRRRVLRLLMVENLILAVPGAILGVLLARRAIPAMLAYAEWLAAPERIFLNIDVDGLVIAFSAIVACASAVVFGFGPALRSSRVDLVSVINEDASPRGGGRGRFRAGLVVAQVAVSLLLLVGAGLALESVDAARRANPGFDANQVAVLGIDLRQNGYDAARGRVFYRQLLEAVRGEAGVEAAALAAYTPLGLIEKRAQRVEVEGYEPHRDEDLGFTANEVGPDYFRALRIEIVAGRPFEDGDDAEAAAVVMVNRPFAERFWGGAANALGKRVRVAGGEWRTVVGVSADVKYTKINDAPKPYVYLPFLQSYRSSMILHVRGTGAIERLIDRARDQVAALDADLPLLFARPLTEATRGALIFFELMATMLLAFGAVGMAMAALGTYGLVSYAVKQSVREIGIRIALGATRSRVVRAFVGRGLKLGLAGAALGVITALALSRFLGSVLFGVSPTDLTSFTRALLLILGVVVLATLAPAWRAARTNAMRVLRHQ